MFLPRDGGACDYRGALAKRHYVDHTLYDTILKLVETRWNLRPLGTRDAADNDLTDAFNF